MGVVMELQAVICMARQVIVGINDLGIAKTELRRKLWMGDVPKIALVLHGDICGGRYVSH
jgi:hypothetical protein